MPARLSLDERPARPTCHVPTAARYTGRITSPAGRSRAPMLQVRVPVPPLYPLVRNHLTGTEGIGVRATVADIEPYATVELVVSEVTPQVVVAFLAMEPVVVFIAPEHVITRAAFDRVVTLAATDRVIPCQPIDLVVAVRADDDVGPVGAAAWGGEALDREVLAEALGYGQSQCVPAFVRK